MFASDHPGLAGGDTSVRLAFPWLDRLERITYSELRGPPEVLSTLCLGDSIYQYVISPSMNRAHSLVKQLETAFGT